MCIGVYMCVSVCLVVSREKRSITIMLCVKTSIKKLEMFKMGLSRSLSRSVEITGTELLL